MFDMLSGGIGAGAKRCKSSWETTNGIREIQLKYNRIKMRKIPPHNKKKEVPRREKKRNQMGSPRRDGQKQVSNSNLNRPLPSRADSPERGASGPSETDYVLASFSFSLILFYV
jgi:hypothetical protein